MEHIIRYCEEIEEAQEHFGNSLESLQVNTIYRNAVAMCILQIGELTKHLTDDFKKLYGGMPWHDIKGMRNIAAHHYSKFDAKKLWETIYNDIPELKTYCEEIIRQHTAR